MGGHDRVHALVDRALEGHQLHRVETRAIARHDGEADVRVDVRVTVPGEVLRGGEGAARVRAADEGGAQARDELRVGPEGARRDDRVVRVRVHVQDRREEDVHADRARLLRGDAPVLVREAVVTDGAEGHGGRELRAAALPAASTGARRLR